MFMRSFCSVLLLCIMMSLSLMGCAAKQPIVWLNKDVSLKDYEVFEIYPVFNATGGPVSDEALSLLSERLKVRFGEKHLSVVEHSTNKNGVLIVKSELLEFYPCQKPYVYTLWQPLGKTKCTLHIRLFDKSTSQVVADLTISLANGGCLIIPYEHSERVLDDVALSTAEEVSKIMKESVSL